MPNPAPKMEQLEAFKYPSPWKREKGQVRKTVKVRIPEDLVEQVLQYALELDKKLNG